MRGFHHSRSPQWLLAISLLLLCLACDRAEPPTSFAPEDAMAARMDGGLTTVEALGRAIYFDKKLSLKQNQSCADCHDPAWGWTSPMPGVNRSGAVVFGSIRTRFGNRKPPSAAYAAQAPVLYYDEEDEVWVGGSFWDGRAAGWILGDVTAEQAIGPFLNPVEQGLPDAACVVHRIAESKYAGLWTAAWGTSLADLGLPASLDRACREEQPIELGPELRDAVEAAYVQVGHAISAYEASAEVNPFSSKFDAVQAGMARFTRLEQLGVELFEGKALCSECHPSDGPQPLFTDYTYDNLGIPANPLNPIYDVDPGFVDLGLGEFLRQAGFAPADYEPFMGAVKVPTLRNVALSRGNASKAFGHNGVFKSLEQIVRFYNRRDVMRVCEPGEVGHSAEALARVGFDPECWLPPEVAENINVDELGDLGLTDHEERALVAFLRTLSDGWR
jgi:cytochrome c peroxidase